MLWKSWKKNNEPSAAGADFIYCIQGAMLLDLPTSLVVDVVSSWICFRDMAFFDSAVCRKDSRAMWLQILQTKGVVLHRASHHSSDNLSSQLNWLITRNIKCDEFFISSSFFDVATTIQAEFFETAGGNQVRVHTLEFSNLTHNPGAILSMIGTKCKNLKRIIFKECSSLMGADAVFQTNLEALSITAAQIDESLDWSKVELRNLRDLSIDGIGSSIVVQEALECCSNLVRVRLYSAIVDDKCLHILAQRAHRLDTLDFMNCEGYSPAAVIALAKQCSQLRHLEWRVEEATDEEGVTAFLTHCPLLQNLALLGEFTQAIMVAIAMHCGTRLLHLHLANFECTDDSGLAALSERCTALQTLQLNNIGGVSQDALVRLVLALNYLIVVDFAYMHVNNEVLAALASHCSQLQRLHLCGASGFTQMGLMGFVDGCRQLRKVYIEEGTLVVNEFMREMWRRGNPEVELLFENEYAPCWRLDF